MTSLVEANDPRRDELRLKAREESYDQAWNDGDVTSLVDLFVEDAMVVNPRGEMARGRDEIHRALGQFLKGDAKGSRHVSRISQIEFVTEEVALVDGEATLEGVTDSRGESINITHSYTDVFVKKNGDWYISHVRGYFLGMSEPIARAGMLIRRPVGEVFEAFIDPAITSKFWFTRGSNSLREGAVVTWHWDMFGVSADVRVKSIDPNHRILIEWPTPVEWTFTEHDAGATFVTITAWGFPGSPDEKVVRAIDSMGGFSLALAGCKVLLEHAVQLNLPADHNPGAHVRPSAGDPEVAV